MCKKYFFIKTLMNLSFNDTLLLHFMVCMCSIIRTLHDCPSQMNDNSLISNSKLTSKSELIFMTVINRFEFICERQSCCVCSAPNHYLNQCWHRSPTYVCGTRERWVNRWNLQVPELQLRWCKLCNQVDRVITGLNWHLLYLPAYGIKKITPSGCTEVS